MSLHMITHAVMFAVIATLVKKYLQILYQLDDLQDRCLYAEWEHSNKADLNTHKTQDESQKSNMKFNSFETCQSNLKTHVCHFKNLCYQPKENLFVYFYNKDEIKYSSINRNNIPSLSTPADFTGHKLPLTFLSENFSSQFSVRWINKTSYIFNRFKSDNLMHVIHDDLLPLHFTMKHFENLKLKMAALDKFDAQIVFMDDWPPGDYRALYELFTNYQPQYKIDLQGIEQQHGKEVQDGRELVCFSSAIVGLLTDTLWYNYGFIGPQGPILDSTVNAHQIKSTSNFILHHLDSNAQHSIDFIVLISRKENRKIMNEDDLVKAILQEFSMKVVTISSETHSLTDMITLVSNAKGVIGMHGSLLILAMFLKPGSFLIELFPYAVSPVQYTPYKTLANIKGLEINYASWENTDQKSTVSHIDYPSEHGGLMHLQSEVQKEIINQEKVPKHLCCDDPSWLYHIYQDTFVDISAILNLIKIVMKSGKIANTRHFAYLETPSEVRNLNCKLIKEQTCSLNISWEIPWNMQFLTFDKLNYEIILEESRAEASVKYVTDKLKLEIHDRIDCEKDYIVWGKAVVDGMSHDNYISKDCHN
ncbi:protein O-linked-mannose beta-1,4-N-acetylglucosaminyltransferase 2-like isoform X2 [Mytilus edulis]